MKVSVLASGSKGNCTFIDSKKKILIDTGISYRRIENSLSDLDYSLDDIDGIFITHEHKDHIGGLKTIKNKTDIPIFINKKSFIKSGLKKTTEKFISGKINLGNLSIKPINVDHDAANTYSYLVNDGKKNFASITDLGRLNEEIKDVINICDACVLESNHDIDMLLNGNYPYHLKQRIIGPLGHLSNVGASLAVRQYSTEKLKTVFLAHLSENNNTTTLARDIFEKINKNLNIDTIMTHQKKYTEIIKF